MKEISVISAEKRSESGKGFARRLRASGRVPAVVYGKGEDTVSVSLDAHEALQLFQAISVDNTIVNLEVAGEEPMETLVREIQVHPFRTELIHVDFYRIQRGVALEVDVPVHFHGTPIGVKEKGGILDVILHQIRVSCMPSKIPESIDIDIEGLDLGESLHISDLPVEEGVEILSDPIRTICTVGLPKAEPEPEEDEEAALLEGEEEAEDGAEDGAEGEAAPGAEGETEE